MMMTVIRLFIGIGLFALGYYVGREVGRLESVREEMHRLSEAVDHAGISGSSLSDPPYAET